LYFIIFLYEHICIIKSKIQIYFLNYLIHMDLAIILHSIRIQKYILFALYYCITTYLIIFYFIPFEPQMLNLK
jgi:hypothetical protein